MYYKLNSYVNSYSIVFISLLLVQLGTIHAYHVEHSFHFNTFWNVLLLYLPYLSRLDIYNKAKFYIQLYFLL